MIALLKYNHKIYMKYNKFMIPVIFYLLFQLIYYSTGSEKFVPSIIVCASVVFCIMTWMGFSYCELQDWRTEQIVFLKTNNRNLYWISKIIFMSIIESIISLVGVLWPLIISCINNGVFSNDEININDIVLGFLILVLSALMGTLLGMIFQGKVLGNRNRAILVLFLSVIMSVVKIPMANEYPITKIITWLVPPINNLTNSCMNMANFSLSILVIPIIYSMLYIFVEVMVYVGLMKKILF
ncbi:hypothetical protein [Clostridium sp. HBUAS56017]|uniref:hypothetical protein n=1 Tax=Clostridium sp. HBUAS56017 TaxID=2571128 RepID=UPI001177DA38|nr:hypothetical protein [Clostridium sp. HBUAS56017]